MKTVGVKKLRDKLSFYLKSIRNGETILVTDHGEVIAEIKQPSLLEVAGHSRIQLFLQRLIESGGLIPAQRSAPDETFEISSPPVVPEEYEVDVSALLAESRADRS